MPNFQPARAPNFSLVDTMSEASAKNMMDDRTGAKATLSGAQPPPILTTASPAPLHCSGLCRFSYQLSGGACL
jgi:hypothetical protein